MDNKKSPLNSLEFVFNIYLFCSVSLHFCPSVCFVQLAGQSSNGNLHLKTEALAQHYKQEMETLKTERDIEIEKLRVRCKKINKADVKTSC